jgi:hypothetical protein
MCPILIQENIPNQNSQNDISEPKVNALSNGREIILKFLQELQYLSTLT